jgi:hypothetical protein
LRQSHDFAAPNFIAPARIADRSPRNKLRQDIAIGGLADMPVPW